MDNMKDGGSVNILSILDGSNYDYWKMAGSQLRVLLERDGDHYVALPRSLCHLARGVNQSWKLDC
ncbi:hypothetical protein A2U01_0056804 [Trifolium medium]|uniref:Uncharacterized protein n=1 Tax=Trifolium medium TaxID=97028 RepID=A0A392RG52_9FABA|nr:hypothetical protein [Trifolium medium]